MTPRPPPAFTAAQLTGFLTSALAVTNTAALEALIREHVKPVLRHGRVHGTFSGNHLTIDRLIGVDYPPSSLDAVPRVCSLAQRKALNTWVQTRTPLMIAPATARQQMSAYELAEYELLGLGHMTAHGLIDISGKMGSYFTFAQVQAFDHTATPLFMHMITPHLHACMLRIISNQTTPATAASQTLSAAECTVLSWVAMGKSNKEIAVILGRSESTIKNQMHSAMNKLGARNRAHAAHLAFEKDPPNGSTG